MVALFPVADQEMHAAVRFTHVDVLSVRGMDTAKRNRWDLLAPILLTAGLIWAAFDIVSYYGALGVSGLVVLAFIPVAWLAWWVR